MRARLMAKFEPARMARLFFRFKNNAVSFGCEYAEVGDGVPAAYPTAPRNSGRSAWLHVASH